MVAKGMLACIFCVTRCRFSIVNSSVILLFLSGMVALIMLRILRKDLYRYNHLEQSEEAREEARLAGIFCGRGRGAGAGAWP